MQKDIRSLSSEELKAALVEMGEKAFRAKQIEEWIWTKAAGSFDEMTNLSKGLRDGLKENFTLKRITLSEKQKSNDGTVNVHLKLRRKSAQQILA